MFKSDRGSTLLPVIGSVVILTIMLSSIMAISARDLQDSAHSTSATKNLLDLRSALQAVYNQLQTKWQAYGNVTDVNQAMSDLKLVAADVQSWCDSTNGFQGTNITATIVAVDSPTGTNPVQTANQLYQNYLITIHGTNGSISQTLTDTVTISGAVDALNYAMYAPGNIVITGSPEIDGRIAAGNAIYFDSTPWEGTIGAGAASTYVTYEGSPVYFYADPSGFEPADLPLLGGFAGLAATNGLYGFTQFLDQPSLASPSGVYGDASKMKDNTPISSAQLSKYVLGNLQTSTIVPPSNTNNVQVIVDNADASIKASARAIQSLPYGQFKRLDEFPLSGAYIQYPPGQGPYVLPHDNTVNGPVYFDGDLTIPANVTLTLTQPLFVTGNLVVNGILNSSATIYVGGKTTITNVPTDTPGTTPSRLEIFAKGDMDLAFLSQGSVGPAKTVTTFHAFLASNTNVYLEGMDSFYRIIGGVSGANLILNATDGAGQIVAYPYLKSTNRQDMTRRLWIQYDNSYVTNPLTGTPTVSNLKLQPLPLPYVASS